MLPNGATSSLNKWSHQFRRIAKRLFAAGSAGSEVCCAEIRKSPQFDISVAAIYIRSKVCACMERADADFGPIAARDGSRSSQRNLRSCPGGTPSNRGIESIERRSGRTGVRAHGYRCGCTTVSVVPANGSNRWTTRVSTTQLMAMILPSDVAVAGPVLISALTLNLGTAGGGASSNAFPLRIGNPPLILGRDCRGPCSVN